MFIITLIHSYHIAFSALTLLVGRQEGHAACKKTEWWGAGMVICLERGADLHTAQLTGFTFLVQAHLGSPRKKAVKRVCVCVCVWLSQIKFIYVCM